MLIGWLEAFLHKYISLQGLLKRPVAVPMSYGVESATNCAPHHKLFCSELPISALFNFNCSNPSQDLHPLLPQS